MFVMRVQFSIGLEILELMTNDYDQRNAQK